MFLVVIDYASIVLFFVVLAGLLFLFIRQKPEKAAAKARAQVQAQSSTRVQTISYGLLAGLLVLLIMVAVLADWGTAPIRSRT